MSLDKHITFDNLRLFANEVDISFKGTGSYPVDKGFFQYHMNSTMAMNIDKSDTKEILNDYLEFLRELHDKNGGNIMGISSLKGFLWDTDLEDLPVHVHSEDIYKRIIATWRLKINK